MTQRGKNMARQTKVHALCMLGNEDYRRTLRIYNTHCFFRVNNGFATRLIVTLYLHCLSCYCVHLNTVW
jgi:hypothetical protein